MSTKNVKEEDVMEREAKNTGSKGNRKPRNKGGNKQRRPKNRTGYREERGGNDLSWHVQSETLLKQSSDLSFSYATGNPVDYQYKDPTAPLTNKEATYRMPGLAVIYDTMALGSGENDIMQPMTYAANTLMQEIRSKIRPNQSYDAPDVAMLMGGAAEVYGLIAFLKRLVATTNMYSTMNSYLPDMLFKAQRVDPTYLVDYKASFCAKLNELIMAMNKIYIPNRMTLFSYITEKYSNYYIEGPSIKDQIYLFSPSMFKAYVPDSTAYYESALIPCITLPYDAGHAGTIPGVQGCKTGSSDVPADVLLNTLAYMIRNLINSSDTPIICGDLENAFGSENRFIIPMIEQDVMAVPTFNEEILEMFMNARCCTSARQWFYGYDYKAQIALPADRDKQQGWVVQFPSTNNIYSQTSFLTSDTNLLNCYADSRDTILNMHDSPSAAKVMLLSRYANFVSYIFKSTTPDKSYCRVSCAASLVTNIQFWRMTSPTTMTNVDWPATVGSLNLSVISATDPFHYRPMIVVRDSNGDVDTMLIRADIIGVLRNAQQHEMNRLDLMTMCGVYDRF